MKEDILKWLRLAIDTEERGLKFYRKCREEVRHPRGVELFDFLIKAENGHKRVLSELFDAVSAGDPAKLKRSVDDFLAMEHENPMFPKEKLDKMLKSDTRLTEMFNTAVDLEVQGIMMYSDLAEKESDPDVKRLLKRLAADERTHKREIVDLGHFVFGMPVLSDHSKEPE